LFAVASGTGVRAGQLLALIVSDMDFTKKTVSVSKSADDNTRLIRKPKTKKSVGTVPMPSALEADAYSYTSAARISYPFDTLIDHGPVVVYRIFRLQSMAFRSLGPDYF